MDSKSRMSRGRSIHSVQRSSNNTRSEVNQKVPKQEKPQLRVKEVHNGILDLRDSRYKNGETFKYSSEKRDAPKFGVSEKTSQKTSQFSRNFDLTTNIIAERIVSKQFELLQSRKLPLIRRESTVSKIPQRINNIVAQRILDVDAQLSNRLRRKSTGKNVIEVIKGASNNMISSTSEEAVRETKDSRPRFQLSTRISSFRKKTTNAAAQVNLEKDTIQSDDTRTNLSTSVRSMNIQVTPRVLSRPKKTQTRMYKRSHVETSPVYFPSPSKYTNTTTHYSSSDQSTQFYEYMSRSDLFCLDWINKHLFEVRMNLHNIIMDEKIREVSEIGTKSTWFSDVDSVC